MLTRDDRTLPDAQRIWEDVASVGVHARRLQGRRSARAASSRRSCLRCAPPATRRTSRLVSETPEDELRSAKVALRVAPDYLIGGTQVEPVMS